MRKKITLISAMSCFLFCIVYTVMLLQQSLFVDQARQEFYDRKITKQQQQLQHNLDILNNEVKEISRESSITEVFVQKSVSLERFPNASKNGVRSIRFTDVLGKVIYSSHEYTQEFNKQISHEVLEWSKNIKEDNAFFFIDRDHIISIQRYQNPYLMGSFGYIVVEFSSSQLFNKLRIPHYFVRIVGHQPATLILSDTKNINIELASILALKKDNITPRNGRTFDVPMLGQVVYYMGEDFYVPPIMTAISVVIFLLGLMLLRLYNSEPKTKDEYGSKISQLIQDIEDGNNYSKSQASEAINNASNFGVIKDLDVDNDIDNDVDNFDDIEALIEVLDEDNKVVDFEEEVDIEDEVADEVEEDEIDDDEINEVVDEDIEELSDFSDIDEDNDVDEESEEIDEDIDEDNDVDEESEEIDEDIDEDNDVDEESEEDEIDDEINEVVDEDIEMLSDFSDVDEDDDVADEVEEDEIDDDEINEVVEEDIEMLSDFSDIDEDNEVVDFEEEVDIEDDDVEIDEVVEEDIEMLSDFSDIIEDNDVADEVEEDEIADDEINEVVDEDIEELSDFSDIDEDNEVVDFEEEVDIDNDVADDEINEVVEEDIEMLSDFSDIDEDNDVDEESEEIDEDIDEVVDFEEEVDIDNDVADEVEEDEIDDDEINEVIEEDIEMLSDFSDIIEDKIIDTEEDNEDTLQQIIPLDDTDDVDESFIPHYALGNFKNETVQKYMDELADILEQYDISNYAVAEEDENLYIFNGESFGAQFIIDKEDELYQEVLSKGNALSLSGDLMDSEYLENLFSRELLSEFTELYIRPIMEDGNVKGIVVLSRDGEVLSQDEKKDLLKNH